MGSPGNFNQEAPISYASQCGPTTVLSPFSGGQLGIGEVVITNRAAASIDVGWGYKQPDAMWKAGQIDVSATPDYIDDTTDAQDAGASDFALFTTTVNDGFLIQSVNKFNVVGITIGTAASGGSPVYVYSYYDGTSMVALTQATQMYAVPVYTSTGNILISFPSPPDWAKGATAAVGADSDKYALHVTASTASSTAGGLATIIWVCTLSDFFPQLGDDAALNTEMITEIVIPGGASIVPYFGTAAAGNTIQLHWRPLGVLTG